MSYGRGYRGSEWEVLPVLKTLGIITAAAVVVLAVVALIASPIIHPLAIGIWKHWPGLLVLGIAIAGAVLAATGRGYIGVPLVIVFLLWAVIGGVFGDAWKKEA